MDEVTPSSILGVLLMGIFFTDINGIIAFSPNPTEVERLRDKVQTLELIIKSYEPAKRKLINRKPNYVIQEEDDW